MPDICFGGGYYFAVWTDNRNSNYEIYGARVTPAGNVLDPNGILIGYGDQTYYYYYSAVVYNNTNYFVVASVTNPTPYRIIGRFINPNGSYGSDTMSIFSSAQAIYRVRIAFSGSNYLLTWIEYQPVGYTYVARGQILSTSGTPVGSPFTIADSVDYSSLAVRYSGFNYLVTFSKSLTSGGNPQICGRFYSTTGTPISGVFNISNNSFAGYNPDMYPGGNNKFLTVWSEYHTDYDIYGNLDVSVGIEDQSVPAVKHKAHLPTIITDRIVFPDRAAAGEVFDAAGRLVGWMTQGVFDFSDFNAGVYVIRTADRQNYRFIKIK